MEDLIELIDRQLGDPRRWDGETVNVGGGRGCSLSLREATALCAEITGNRVELSGAVQTRPGDVPLYISDCSRLAALTDWRPQRGPREILADVHRWIHEHETAVQHAL
ncbi:MAG: hypothetical protein JO169_03450 [Solirubrobacterales bacterium]|nr:hypothetical protein [Solirubrobacterales bacterium]